MAISSIFNNYKIRFYKVSGLSVLILIVLKWDDFILYRPFKEQGKKYENSFTLTGLECISESYYFAKQTFNNDFLVGIL